MRKSFLFVSLAIVFIVNSCRKIDRQSTITENLLEQKFFNSNRSGDKLENSIVSLIKRENNKYHFVETVVKRIGFPYWNKSINWTHHPGSGRGQGDNDSTSYFLTPFIKENENKVNAILIFKLTDRDTLFKYVCDWQYSKLQNSLSSVSDSAEIFASLFMMLDREVFEHNKFEIIDSSIFRHSSHTPLYVRFDTTSFHGHHGRNLNMIEHCEDITIYYQNCPWNNENCLGPNGTCDNCWQCISYFTMQYCWTEWVEGGGGGEWFPTGGGEPGGGGGGGGWDPPQCPEGGSGRFLVLNPCAAGWEPVLDEPLEIIANPDANNNIDENNNTTGGYDNTSYPQFDITTQIWPTVDNVIQKSDFVPWPNPHTNCLTLAKQQIAKKNFQISDYGASGQTFQIYTSANGADINKARDAVSYLIYALQNDIPVIVGIDNRPGSPNPQTDNTTDHFVVIVGMGTDNYGNFFRFYDNSTNWQSKGTHDENKLYYNPTTGIITGKSQSGYATSRTNMYDYIVTMVRKSKTL